MVVVAIHPRAGAVRASPYTPFTPPLGSELGRAFAQVCQGETASATSDLHDATVTLVERLKADGLPPERVVVAIKDALRHYRGCGLAPSLTDEASAGGERQATAYRRVFGWYLETYYSAN